MPPDCFEPRRRFYCSCTIRCISNWRHKYINKIKIMALPGFELPFFFFLSFFSFFSMLPGCTYLVFCSCFWRMILSKRKLPCAIKQLFLALSSTSFPDLSVSTASNFSGDLVEILNRPIVLVLQKRPWNLKVGEAVLDFILALHFFGKLCSIILSSNSSSISTWYAPVFPTCPALRPTHIQRWVFHFEETKINCCNEDFQ